MKKISTLFASFMVSAAVFAADAKPSSMLTVISADKSNIRVMLDGTRFEPNASSVMIPSVMDGSHMLVVYRERNSGVTGFFTKRFELVYNATVNVKKKTNLFVTVEKNGRISMSENKIRKNNDVSYGYDNGVSGQWGQYDNNYGYERGMDDREFSRVMQSIDKEWLESNKLKSALQIVNNNKLTAAQVKEMVLLFSFENNKLELAKQAYGNTVDKRNYPIVFDAFSFANTKSDLDRYIRNYR